MSMFHPSLPLTFKAREDKKDNNSISNKDLNGKLFSPFLMSASWERRTWEQTFLRKPSDWRLIKFSAGLIYDIYIFMDIWSAGLIWHLYFHWHLIILSLLIFLYRYFHRHWSHCWQSVIHRHWYHQNCPDSDLNKQIDCQNRLHVTTIRIRFL